MGGFDRVADTSRWSGYFAIKHRQSVQAQLERRLTER
jgi:hypothetical protein